MGSRRIIGVHEPNVGEFCLQGRLLATFANVCMTEAAQTIPCMSMYVYEVPPTPCFIVPGMRSLLFVTFLFFLPVPVTNSTAIVQCNNSSMKVYHFYIPRLIFSYNTLGCLMEPRRGLGPGQVWIRWTLINTASWEPVHLKAEKWFLETSAARGKCFHSTDVSRQMTHITIANSTFSHRFWSFQLCLVPLHLETWIAFLRLTSSFLFVSGNTVFACPSVRLCLFGC